MNPELDDIEPVSPRGGNDKENQIKAIDNMLSSEKKWSKADLIKTNILSETLG